jgi:hypothetical protein
MSCVQRVAEDNDPVFDGMLEKLKCVVGVMAINQKHMIAPLGLLPCLLIKELDDCNPDLAIDPALL